MVGLNAGGYETNELLAGRGPRSNPLGFLHFSHLTSLVSRLFLHGGWTRLQCFTACPERMRGEESQHFPYPHSRVERGFRNC
jgi:hypothetical protein